MQKYLMQEMYLTVDRILVRHKGDNDATPTSLRKSNKNYYNYYFTYSHYYYYYYYYYLYEIRYVEK